VLVTTSRNTPFARREAARGLSHLAGGAVIVVSVVQSLTATSELCQSGFGNWTHTAFLVLSFSLGKVLCSLCVLAPFEDLSEGDSDAHMYRITALPLP
jgi:hypothetical protein